MFKFFARGKRGIVYKGRYNGKDVILKAESRDLRRINNEVKWLKRLNKFDIGPKLIFEGDGWFICEFVKGIPLNKWVKGKSKVRVRKVFKNLLEKARIMDKLKVDKLEMHRPFKNVLVFKDKAKMIDFERCRTSLKPKNVTQFFQFVVSVLGLNRKEIIKDLKEYSKNYSEKNYKKLVKKLKKRKKEKIIV